MQHRRPSTMQHAKCNPCSGACTIRCSYGMASCSMRRAAHAVGHNAYTIVRVPVRSQPGPSVLPGRDGCRSRRRVAHRWKRGQRAGAAAGRRSSTPASQATRIHACARTHKHARTRAHAPTHTEGGGGRMVDSGKAGRVPRQQETRRRSWSRRSCGNPDGPFRSSTALRHSERAAEPINADAVNAMVTRARAGT